MVEEICLKFCTQPALASAFGVVFSANDLMQFEKLSNFTALGWDFAGLMSGNL